MSLAMVKMLLDFVVDLKAPLVTRVLTTTLQQGDSEANVLQIRLKNGTVDAVIGENVTVSGYAMRADGDRVALVGEVSGSTVTVVLTEVCYQVAGPFAAFVRLTSESGIKRTVLRIAANVESEGDGPIIDPSSRIPSIETVLELLKKVEDAAEDVALAAENAVEALPYVGENHNWFVWNAEKRQHVDTGIKAKGDSDYEIAVQQGFEGTESEWLETLKGASAYQVAVQQGFEGTEDEWLESIKMRANEFAVSTLDPYWWTNSEVVISPMEEGWLNMFQYVDISVGYEDAEQALAVAKALFRVSKVDKTAGTITIERLGEPFRGNVTFSVRVVR